MEHHLLSIQTTNGQSHIKMSLKYLKKFSVLKQHREKNLETV